MNISVAIDSFVSDFSKGGNAPSTAMRYKNKLQEFSRVCKKIEVEDITLEDLVKFFDYQKSNPHVPLPGRKAVPFSFANYEYYRRVFRAFFLWASKKLGIKNIAINIKEAEYKPPEIDPFTQEEIAALLKGCKSRKANYISHGHNVSRSPVNVKRDLAIIYLLLDTGMLLGELANIQIQDISLKENEILIRVPIERATKKSRHVYIGERSKEIVSNYLLERKRNEGLLSPESQFLSTTGGDELKSHGIQQMLTKLGQHCGIENVHPQRFRVTASVEYLRNGGDIFTLQRMLGHNSLQMVTSCFEFVNKSKASHEDYK